MIKKLLKKSTLSKHSSNMNLKTVLKANINDLTPLLKPCWPHRVPNSNVSKKIRDGGHYEKLDQKRKKANAFPASFMLPFKIGTYYQPVKRTVSNYSASCIPFQLVGSRILIPLSDYTNSDKQIQRA